MTASRPRRPGLRRRSPTSSRIPIKKPAHSDLTVDQQAYNVVHGALRCLGERANSLLKTTFKALRRYRGCPWRIGAIVAAALVLLHHETPPHHLIHLTDHTARHPVTRRTSL